MKAGMDKFSNIKNEELLMLDEVYSELLRLDLKRKCGRHLPECIR